MANLRIYNLRIFAISFVAKPPAMNDRFCFQKKMGFGILSPYPRKLLSN
jgi:hypothetical protein